MPVKLNRPELVIEICSVILDKNPSQNFGKNAAEIWHPRGRAASLPVWFSGIGTYKAVRLSDVQNGSRPRQILKAALLSGSTCTWLPPARLHSGLCALGAQLGGVWKQGRGTWRN